VLFRRERREEELSRPRYALPGKERRREELSRPRYAITERRRREELSRPRYAWRGEKEGGGAL